VSDRVDADRTATQAERLGLVAPDDAEDDTVVIVHVSGGLVAEVGALEVARLRVATVDDDLLDDGESEGVWTEPVSELRPWSREATAALVRPADELPQRLRRELGLVGP